MEEDQGEPRDERPPRRRGRTALLIAAAAVLGVVAGTATGYGIQADRDPTPLPPLSQRDLAHPAPLPKGKAPEPLSAKEDRRVRTDGDLRKLLIGKPTGAREASAPWLKDGWLRLNSYALNYESEDYMFEELLDDDFRRAVSVTWEQGEHRETGINLVQFRSGSSMGAAEHAKGQLAYMSESEDGAGNRGNPVKGSGSGRYYLYDAEEEPGYLPIYRARAIAHRGDIVLDINIFDTKPISKKDIRTLAERQLERL